MLELLSYFSSYEGWVSTHVFFPYVAAKWTGSRAIGLMLSYFYESLTAILAIGFGCDLGYSGGIEGLVQDPALALVGVLMASRRKSKVAGSARERAIVYSTSVVAGILLLTQPNGPEFVLWFFNLGGFLPALAFLCRNCQGSLWKLNGNDLDVLRIYVLLCLAHAVSYWQSQSSFLWMLALVLLPEIVLIFMNRSRPVA